ncbi:hypothetical protein U9M48_020081 [Paspalum notatum var. saurae]|uniref:Uncharacterized protein n=1 Tax=Paspalum notatum var. saurae TaxID=547442 RepID=A0AAQ3TG71_PASNO
MSAHETVLGQALSRFVLMASITSKPRRPMLASAVFSGLGFADVGSSRTEPSQPYTSAQETTPGHLFSTAALISSRRSKAARPMFTGASFSGTRPGERKHRIPVCRVNENSLVITATIIDYRRANNNGNGAYPDEAVMEDEADEGGADAAVGLERLDHVPLDDVLHALAFLAVVAELQLAGLRRRHGGEEHRRLHCHKGDEDCRRELHYCSPLQKAFLIS